MKLLLDEMIGPGVAAQLRALGRDVEAVVEHAELRGLPDERVLEIARDEGRILVTRNIADFALLDARWAAAGRQHCGIVMIGNKAFPENRAFIGNLVMALQAAIKTNALPGPGEVRHLSPRR